MKQIFLFLFIFLLTSCISGGAKQDQVKVMDRTIRIGDAMEHPVPMKLSNFVDSITYIPLETTKSYVKDKMLIFYMKPYWIVYPGSLFDEEGRFVANIGALGQGPGEESGFGYSVFYDRDRDLFYTQGDKIYQFDSKGKFTGKEIRIAYRDKGIEGKIASGLKNVYTMVKSGKDYLIVNYPDSIFWMDAELNIRHGARIIPDSLFLTPPGVGGGMPYTFSDYGDTTIFYNCFTDAIYTVTDTGLQKRWTLEFKGSKADNRCFLNDYKKLYLDEYVKIVSSSKGNVETMKEKAQNSELAQLIDNKKWVYHVSEGERYLFLWWLNLKAFSSAWRGYNESHIALYDKRTGETVAIAGDGLIDDIDNGMTFFPRYGICNNAMVSSVWPFELKEYIQEKKAKGEAVSDRLIALADSLDDEQNPILVIAHLKK